MPIIPLECPSCGANLSIDSEHDAALCNHCGKPFVVKDAIVQNYINNVITINAGTVNVVSQKDFVIEGGVLKKYQGEAINVKIPENVIKIEQTAFDGQMIKSLSIPEGVEELEIYNCPHLTSINLPSTLKNVSINGCARLESPADIVFSEIINDVFILGSTKIKNVVIPKNASMKRIVFSGSSELETITLPEKMIIDKSFRFEFRGCSSLKSITLPRDITYLQSYSFEGCSKLENIDIPSSVVEIGNYAFSSCSNLKRINLPKGLKHIGSGAFAATGIENIRIPTGCYVAPDAFYSTPFFEKKVKETQEKAEQEKRKKAEWQAAGLCPYCGGKKSFWDNRCKSCGRVIPM